ncbi:probable ubiquitin carboxyl-terminal hydrolase FAF-X [Xenia sp. Carnegie-2017]|uniref:probable ubiquitin carboxyl-terminal hydrolase FAF-X n=1 Tax=Xenia sp. Carnegie-2017 TaxID=2897299 RepID=UPI001F046AE5|nr:probable ubiquitin carboxyl-terminal hydrolase FAF-X [Xenia sp. Carnegie-2017]
MTVSVRGGVPLDQTVPVEGTSQDDEQLEGKGESSETTPAVNDEENEDNEVILDENGCPVFPIEELSRLDEMIGRQKWVVPVLPKCELEILLRTSIKLCRAGLDTKSEQCQRFFREGLTVSFQKILNDDAVHSWKYEIQKCIYNSTKLLIELCVLKLSQDWFVLLDMLALAFNPHCRFHIFNAGRAAMNCGQVAQDGEMEIFATPRSSKGWLIDFVNHFGMLGGFKLLQERICNGGSLSVSLLAALIRPFGPCAQVLCSGTVKKYFAPVIECVQKFLDNLTNEELKKETKNESKTDSLSSIIKALKSLAAKLPKGEEVGKDLETFRLKMIFRLLQVSSFNGKMNALNEINKVISSVSYYSQRHLDDEEWLTADKMAEWIHENDVLSIVLKDNLHQPQYVEKLEKIIRFVIKEKALTLVDLDHIWSAQAGKHDVIVKNIHDLLAKLAWDFSAEQLDHLFECFQESWTNASKKQREKLLELIRRLAEDDKEGVMAHKVLGLLWNLAHKDDVPTDIMDQALSAHIKILDYSCSQDRDSQKTQWINRCVEELRNDTWVLPAIKQIREICCLFYEAPTNYSHTQKNPHVFYRHDVINDLQTRHQLISLMASNLKNYMSSVRDMEFDKSSDPDDLLPDGRYCHVQQVQKRLSFLRFILRDGQLWLCAPEAKIIWEALGENSVFESDREACFKWFSKLMGDEQDLNPEISGVFFESKVLKIDQSCLTENGMECFERFFQKVNIKEGKFVSKRRMLVMDDLDLIGIDYLWEIALRGSERIVGRAVNLLKQSYTNLGPRLRANQVDIHEKIIQKCMHNVKPSYEVLQKESVNRKNCKNKSNDSKIREAALRIVRCLTVLREYIAECDDDYSEERIILPHGRSYCGKHITLVIRTATQGRPSDDFELWSHLNETIASVRRHILQRMRNHYPQITRIDLYIGGELLSPVDDKRLIGKCNLPERVIITVRIGNANSSMPSSPDSSDDSSGSPPATLDGPNIEAERCLPGVIIATKTQYVESFLRLAEYSIQFDIPELREEVWFLLGIIPTDRSMVENMRKACSYKAEKEDGSDSRSFEACFNSSLSSQTVYNLETLYALLMPAGQLHREKAVDFQMAFFKSGGVKCILDLVTKPNFLEFSDTWTRSLSNTDEDHKVCINSVAYAKVYIVAEAFRADTRSDISDETKDAAVVLQQALQCIPNLILECVLRTYALSLGQRNSEEISLHTPDFRVVKAIQKISWTAAGGMMDILRASPDEIHKSFEKMDLTSHFLDINDINTCKESTEVLTLCLAIQPNHLETLSKDRSWQSFITDLVLRCNNSSLRWYVVEQFFVMATRCSDGHRPLIFFITLLFSVLTTIVENNPETSGEYFTLLSKLLHFAHSVHAPYSTAEKLLTNEIHWLKRAKDLVKSTGNCESVQGCLLEGHILIARELLLFLSPVKKHYIGCAPDGPCLVKELLDEFIFPASKMVIESRKCGDVWNKPVIAVCNTSPTLVAAFELLVSLCTGCIENLQYVANALTELYYSGNEMPLLEWEYTPPIGPRPMRGFVGLKNAGATCYMNSVIQQLFMICKVRDGILVADETLSLPDEESVNNDEKTESEGTSDTGYYSEDTKDYNNEKDCNDREKEAKLNLRYQKSILRQMQFIFGHLKESQLQYYVPQGLWKTFKYQGERVNLREQHDALEFFNSLIDILDEGLKAVGHEPVLIRVLGGIFADQKICKGCPHRYSKDDPFIALTIDIRNHQNLIESLDQFVKGDLLEGANAYHCDKCNKKIDTVKRMCFKKLPKVLAIQLKRFDYDWERDVAVKFNDYFEFPREFDMEPYTVQGLARIENDPGEFDESTTTIYEEDEKRELLSTKYRLVGVVVHSGQASGGHYYSYIRTTTHGCTSWFKFDDGDVSDCKMDDDEELKTQCFGGEYMGEVFDHMMKRMSYRRQKRWWNAYILFYERIEEEDNGFVLVKNDVKIPCAIEQEVRKQNMEFLHNRIQFSNEYFDFIRKLVTVNINLDSEDVEDLAMISMQLLSKFLFSCGLRTKKTIRGPAGDWYEAITGLLRQSKIVRLWFAQNVLFTHSERISEYLLESPSPEVRTMFARMLVFLCRASRSDGECDPPYVMEEKQLENNEGTKKTVLSEYILRAVLKLLDKEVPENGRNLHQYFSFFCLYMNLGTYEKKQLLDLNVPAAFIQLALDEGPGLSIRYQYPELGKLHAVISCLIRSCDVSHRWQSSMDNGQPIRMRDMETIMKLQSNVDEQIFVRFNYIKKMIECYTDAEETVLLLKYCCWENPQFSSSILKELLFQIACLYTYELRPYMDLLLEMTFLKDSWQRHRIANILKGSDGKDGIFDTIQRSRNHYHKRVYQCIKFLVALFSNSQMAYQVVLDSHDLKSKWTAAVDWLNDELDRRPFGSSNAYPYNNWSPPAQSNETSNGVFLERSQSARLTLQKAFEFVPEEEQEETAVEDVTECEITEDENSSERESNAAANQSTSSISGQSDSTIPQSADQSLDEVDSSLNDSEKQEDDTSTGKSNEAL